jgi:hypothetical protein
MKGHGACAASGGPAVGRVLETPGRPLDASIRTDLEGQFGHNFARVRIHADERAAAAADAVLADAFTVGEHIGFAQDRYAPATEAGRRLLAHELAHVVQQARGVVPLSTNPLVVYRQPAPGKGGLTRDELAKKLKVIFGHDVKIEVGDKERQTKELGGPAGKRRLPDDWKSWDPGTRSPLYDEILGAMEDFGRAAGGLPNLGQIIFFNVRYVYDDQLNVVADTKAAAEISPKQGAIFVYRNALFEQTAEGASGTRISGVPLATKRSTAKETAPESFGTRSEGQRRTIAHELGHGVERASRSLSEFQQAVGWADRFNLYDIQAKGVKQAIAKGVEPPAAARITKDNWNSGKHLEQPMSKYAVTDSTEDFAESMMAWLYTPDVLKARSPERFKFFDDADRRKAWLPKLVTPGTPTPATPPPSTTPPATTKETR